MKKTKIIAEGIKAGMGELIGARVASRGVGYLSVLGPVVSEPIKIKLLRDHSPSGRWDAGVRIGWLAWRTKSPPQQALSFV